MENKNHPWRVVGIILLGLALMVAGPLAIRIRDQRQDEQRTFVRSNLKLIQIAMTESFVQYKGLPRSPEGPDQGIYKLKPYIDAECFDGDLKKSPEARAVWDEDEKRLKNSDFFYLNEPSVKPDFARIILISRPGLTRGWVYLATGFSITGHSAAEFDLRLLGSCQTPDLFLIANYELYQDWLRTHPDSLAQSGSNVGLIRGANVAIDYKFEGKRLKKRSVTTDKGVIEETVELD